MRKATVILSALVLVGGTGAAAEEPSSIAPGTRLRVTTTGARGFLGTFEGTMTRLGEEELTLVDVDRGAVMTIPTSSVVRLQVSAGKRRRVLKTMLIGGLAFGVAGALAGGVDDGTGRGCSLDDITFEPCGARTALKFGGLMGLAGAGSGALFGYFFQKETWSDTSLERLQVRLAPTRGGARMALSLSF